MGAAQLVDVCAFNALSTSTVDRDGRRAPSLSNQKVVERASKLDNGIIAHPSTTAEQDPPNIMPPKRSLIARSSFASPRDQRH